eukprot:g54996.t1
MRSEAEISAILHLKTAKDLALRGNQMCTRQGGKTSENLIGFAEAFLEKLGKMAKGKAPDPDKSWFLVAPLYKI